MQKMSVAEAMEAAPEMPGQGKRTDLLEHPSHVRKLKEGNSASYLAARIKRDHPEIALKSESPSPK